MIAIELLAVIEFPETKRVRCLAEQCGRSIYRAVHIVWEGSDFRIYGSECAKKLFGLAGPRGRLDRTSYVTGDLSERDVDLLKENTAAPDISDGFRFRKLEMPFSDVFQLIDAAYRDISGLFPKFNSELPSAKKARLLFHCLPMLSFDKPPVRPFAPTVI